MLGTEKEADEYSFRYGISNPQKVFSRIALWRKRKTNFKILSHRDKSLSMWDGFCRLIFQNQAFLSKKYALRFRMLWWNPFARKTQRATRMKMGNYSRILTNLWLKLWRQKIIQTCFKINKSRICSQNFVRQPGVLSQSVYVDEK